MDDKLILPIHFADGSSKSIAVPHDSTVKNVIDAVLAKSPPALMPSQSQLDLSKAGKPTKGLNSSEWRLMVVRKFRREGQMFTVGELNDPTTVRVMSPGEHISNELGKLLNANPESPTKRSRRKSNVVDSKEAPRFKLVHPEYVVKVQFRQIPEFPGDYITSIYVTPTMSADTFVEILINEFSLRPGYLAIGEEVKKYGSRYALLEVRELINGTFDNRKLTDKETVWKLWTDSQQMLGSRALRDAYFCIKPDEMSWLKKMNSQAFKLRDKVLSGTSSTYSMPYVPSKATSTNQLEAVNGSKIEVSSPTISEKRDNIKSLLSQPNGDEKAKTELELLSELEFDALFDKFLDEINIRNAESRRDMCGYDRRKKSLLLIQQWKHQKDSDDNREFLNVSEMASPTSATASTSQNAFFNFLKKESTSGDKTPQYYIEKLSTRNLPSKTLLRVLVSLRVTLSTAKMAWIREFVENGTGISALGGVLDRVLVAHKSAAMNSSRSSDTEEEIRAECVKCLRVLLNTEPGYYNVLQSQIIVTKLTLCLHSSNDRVRMTVAEVLAALCVLSNEGHRMVLNGFVDFRGFYAEPKKFFYLVDSVTQQQTQTTTFSDSNHPLLAYDYKTTAMSLINVLINTPDDVMERHHIRSDIIACGFQDYIRSSLRSNAPSAFTRQIDVFEEELKEDASEMELQAMTASKRVLPPASPTGQGHEELLREYEKVLRENAVLNQQLSLHQAQIKSLETELNEQKQAQQVIAESKLDDAVKKLTEAVEEKDEVIERLQIALDQKTEEISSMTTLMESTLKQFDHDQKEWQQRNKELESTKQELEKQMETLKEREPEKIIVNNNNIDSTELNLLKETVEREKKEFAALKQKETDLLKQVKDTKSELSNKDLQLSAMKHELEMKSEQLKQLQQALQAEKSVSRESTRERTDSMISNASSPAPTSAPIGRAADLMSKLAVKEKECEKLQAEIDRFHQRQRERSEMVQMMVKNFESQMALIAKGESTGQPMFDSRMGAIMEELVKFKQQTQELTQQLDQIKALFPDGVESYKKRLEEQAQEYSLKESALTKAWEDRERAALVQAEELKKRLVEVEEKFAKEVEELKKNPPESSNVSRSPGSAETSSAPPPPPPPSISETGASIAPPPPPPPEISETGASIAPPPPPPPGMSGGPPPPPPAPGAPPGPPPPPGMAGFAPATPALPPGFKAKPKIKPPAPMKNLYWTKLPVSAVGDTVWKEIQDEQEILKSVNTQEITLLFGKNAPQQQQSSGPESPKTSRKSQQNTAVTLLDNNRAQQISIVLARIKMSFDDVRKAFLDLNDTQLAVDQVKSLQAFTPTDEEIEMINEYVNKQEGSQAEAVESLGNAEKYFYSVMKIPRLQQRLNCWLFKRRFDADVRDTRLDLEMVLSAISEVKNSQKMKKLLKIVLAFGNFLNGGTARGEAFGVQLDVLMKTKDLKVNSVKPTAEDEAEAKAQALKYAGVNSLLHYLVKMSNEVGGIDYMEEMPHLETACRVNSQALRAQVKAIKTGMDQIKAEIKSLTESPITDDKFVTVMEEFINSSEQQVETLQKLANSLDTEAKALLIYYGADPSQTSVEEFFNTFLTFNSTINQCKKDIDDATKKILRPQSSPPIKKKIGGVTMGVTMEKGDLENAIKSLKVGSSRKARRGTNSNTDQPQGLEDVIPEKPSLPNLPKPTEESEVLKRIRAQRENLEKAMK